MPSVCFAYVLFISCYFILVGFWVLITLSFMKVIFQMKIRKLIGAGAMLDYQDPVANPTHEPPKRGSPGGRG